MKFKSFAVMALAAFAITASAQTIAVHVSADPLVSLGDQIGTQFDKFTFNDGTANVGFGDFQIGTYKFEVGTNSNSDHTFLGTETFNFSLGSLSESIVVPFTLAISGEDSISFATTSKTLAYGGENYTFTVHSFGSSTGNGEVNGNIFGSITAAVPEPGTYALMLAGMAVVAGVARKRKQA